MSLHLPQPIQPFRRVQVSDGLLLTAEHWKTAHNYHRDRQNVLYQALNQPGIVWGLGVCVIQPPREDVTAQYRDRRWLQVQPGFAIDQDGNLIVVPEPMLFRIAPEAPQRGSLTVYVTIRYVDPDSLQGIDHQRFVQETFCLGQTVTPPLPSEIELCRIRLQPGEVELTSAIDVLNPGANCLDLRYRQQAQSRSTHSVRVLHATNQTPQDTQTAENIASLLRSLNALYPAMQSQGVKPVTVSDGYLEGDLLHISYSHFLRLQASEITALRQFLETGAVVLVEASAQDANIGDLSRMQQQLQASIAALPNLETMESVRQELSSELAAVSTSLSNQLRAMCQPIYPVLEELGLERSNGEVNRAHFLRSQPFLFAQFPIIRGTTVQLFNWGGIVLAVGGLSDAWGCDEELTWSRETIRSAQELGINLLQLARQRRSLTQLQNVNSRQSFL
jgi:hypothetical protein